MSERADASRVIAWANSKPRKPAVLAFTEGPERQAAYWIEWAEARMAANQLTDHSLATVTDDELMRALVDHCAESGRQNAELRAPQAGHPVAEYVKDVAEFEQESRKSKLVVGEKSEQEGTREAPKSACCSVPMNIGGKPGDYTLTCPKCKQSCQPASQSEFNRWRLMNVCKVGGYTGVHF